MLISAGDDTKLFAYCANEFTKFSPHEICPAPQRVPIHLVHNTIFSHTSLLLVQYSCRLDILSVRLENNVESRSSSGGHASTSLLVQVKSKASRKIICSTISNSGMLFAYSDHVKPSLFELKKGKVGQGEWTINKRQLPRKLQFAHSMIFSYDSSQLIIAGHDRRIYVSMFSLIEFYFFFLFLMYLGFFFSLFYIFHEVHAFGRDLGKLPSFSGWYLPCFLLLAMLLSKNLSFPGENAM